MLRAIILQDAPQVISRGRNQSSAYKSLRVQMSKPDIGLFVHLVEKITANVAVHPKASSAP